MEYNQQNMHQVLLRRLRVGEQFKVRNGPMANANASMYAQAGNWLTVKSFKHTTPSRHHHVLYRECSIPVSYYYVDDAFDSWFDYHMDIYQTNLMILKTDRKKPVELKIKPNLPII